MADFFGEHTYQEPLESELENEVVMEASPLKLELDDDEFIKVYRDLLKKSREFYEKKNLKNRRVKNEEYYLGQQISRLEQEQRLKPYSARYLDNVIYDASKTLKAVAISRVPDLLIKPGNDSPESEEVAKDLTEIINSRMRKRETRETLGMAFKHRPLYFAGIIKPIWNSERGRHGDYQFDVVHPMNVEFDHTATTANPDDMSWITHHYERSVKELIMMFPEKKDDLLDELKWGDEQRKDEKRLASKIRISEVWFTWYSKDGEEWLREENVAWIYGKVVLKKMKNPYWDWEGDTNLFTLDIETGKQRPVVETDVRNAITAGRPMETRQMTVYHNHFENPRKPFIFLTYDQLGRHPLDETSSVEQSIFLQDNVNVRGKQITELSALAKGKNVFSTDSGLNARDVEEIDMANPNQDLLIDGNLRDVHTIIPGAQPTAALFQDQDINRERIFSKMGTNAALQGQQGAERTATQTQLFKESDYTRIDDEVEDTVNAAAEEMADWAMQFMKLFYTEEHLIILKGSDGRMIHHKITRDLIEDGMEVEVSASAVDKLKRKREAFELAGIGMIDPLSFFKDIEASDPEGRAEKLFMFQAAPMEYFQKFIRGNDGTAQMAMALQQQPVPGQGPPPAPPGEGQPPMAPPRPPDTTGRPRVEPPAQPLV